MLQMLDAKAPTPRIIFLNQARPCSWQLNLAVDLAQSLGPCLSYAATSEKVNINNLEIRPAPSYRTSSKLSRIAASLSYFFHVVVPVLRSRTKPLPLLFIFSNPQIMPLIGYVLKRLRGQPYVAVVLDIYPNLLVQMGYLAETGLIMRFWRWMNRMGLGHADHVFTLTPMMAQNIKNMVATERRNAPPITIIPPGEDKNFIQPLPKGQNQFAILHNQVGKFTLVYSGNMGVIHDLETVLQAAALLKDDTQIHLLLIGGGAKRPMVESLVKELNLSNVTLLPLQSESLMPYSIAAGEVAIVCLDRRAEGVCIPGKVYTMMAAGLAILAVCHQEGELAKLITETGCGLIVAPGDALGFASAVRRLKSDGNLLKKCQANARNAVEKYFSREITARHYLDVLIPLVVS